MKLEPGERRLVLGLYLVADEFGATSTERTIAEHVDPRDVVDALVEVLERGLRAEAPRVDLLEGQLETERQQRHQAQQRAAAAERDLERQRRTPEAIAARTRCDELEVELERARADVRRLTARLAEGAMAVDASGSRS